MITKHKILKIYMVGMLPDPASTVIPKSEQGKWHSLIVDLSSPNSGSGNDGIIKLFIFYIDARQVNACRTYHIAQYIVPIPVG